MSPHDPDNPVLVVDLDGTLIKTDLLAETASRFLIEQPYR
jgi:phosphatidate phosphatase PAH1